MRDQAIEFSHHVGSLEVTDMLLHFWPLAKYSVAPRTDLDESMHLIIHLMAEARLPPAYVFIHEDAQTEMYVETGASYNWILCRTTLSDRWAPFRGRADTDYSPSKLPSKVARLAAVDTASSSMSSP